MNKGEIYNLFKIQPKNLLIITIIIILTNILTRIYCPICISSFSTISFFILAIIIAPLIEEIIFRYGFQEKVFIKWLHFEDSKKLTMFTIIFIAFAFTLFHHVFWLSRISIFIDAIIFGIIFHKTKNLSNVWYAHALSNLLIMII
jgi:membrane protease YdiL (CAAX protease family)